jgi:branched-chain amino acid transport system substrate-binding protein
MKRSSRWLPLLAVVVLALLVLAACGGGEEEEEVAPTAEATAVSEEPTPTAQPTQGVTDTEVKLGTHLPISKTPAAAWGPIGEGMRAYFDYINDTEGGVYGRKISIEICDDHYNPPDTVECVRKMVEQDKVFAIVGGLGEETHLAVYKYLEEKGIPDLFINSGILIWTDPVVRTRFGGNPVYITEGEMLGEYIAQQYNGKKLGLLIENNEFGEEGVAGIEQGIEGSDVEIVERDYYEVVEFDMTAQTQRLKASGAEVIAAYANPIAACSLLKTAREVLDWDVPVIVSGVNAADIFIDLCGEENAQGVVSVVFGHQIYETDLPGVAKHYEIMEKYGSGVPVDNFTLYGQILGELTVEALKRAGPDLTVDSLVDALEGIKGYQCSVCLAPISFSETDHRPFEIEVYERVEGGRWVTFGEPVNFESTP